MTKGDCEQLIESPGVYRITTSPIDGPNSSPFFIPGNKQIQRSFESRGVINLIGSILTVSLVLLAFLYIHVCYTSSVFREDSNNANPPIIKTDASAWVTSYDLPDDMPLLEIHPSTFDFSSECPEGRFALVLYLDTPISTFEEWMTNCGSQVAYFRMNGEPTVEDVDKIVKFVPTAKYIPIKANLHVAKWDDLLDDPTFQNQVEFEGNIVNSLTISGYLTPEMLKSVIEIAPFVEELTLESPEVCSSLVRVPKLSKQSCEVSWPELRTLMIHGVGECIRTYDFIDTCWDTPKMEKLEVLESKINNINTEYIENFIDRNRITKVNFKSNICSEFTQLSHEYICRD